MKLSVETQGAIIVALLCLISAVIIVLITMLVYYQDKMTDAYENYKNLVDNITEGEKED